MAPIISEDVHGIIEKNAELLDTTIIYDRDFGYDYFGFKTFGKVLFVEGEWQGCRTSAAYVDASCYRYS